MFDYQKIAEQFLECSIRLYSTRPQKNMIKFMQGEDFLLQCLNHFKGELNPGVVSNIMGVTPSRVAATMRQLEKKGLMTRQIDPEDRRRIVIELTEAGREAAEQNHQSMLEVVTDLLKQLGEDDAFEYLRISQRLADLKAEANGSA